VTSFLSKSSFYAIATAYSIASQLVMIPILLKSITIESYGELGLYLGLVAIFTALLPISSENAIARSVFEVDRVLNKQVFATASTIVLVMFLLTIAIVLSLKGWLTESLLTITLLALVSSVLQVFVNFVLVQLQMREEVLKYFLISILQVTFLVALTVYWLPTFGVWARYFSPLASLSIVLISYCVLTKFRYAYFRLSLSGWAYIKKVGLPLAPHSVIGVSINYLDRFVLKLLNYDALLGFYTLSSQIINAIQAALSSINNAYTPWIFGKINENKEPNYKSIILIVAVLCVFVISLLLLFIPLLPKNSYSVVLDSLYLLPIYIFLETTYYLINPILYFKKLGKLISFVSLASAASRAGILLIYLILYEPTLEGMLITLVGASVVKLLLTYWFVSLRYAD
jgi:O-antigen/teichoic acid export membrane protein